MSGLEKVFTVLIANMKVRVLRFLYSWLYSWTKDGQRTDCRIVSARPRP